MYIGRQIASMKIETAGLTWSYLIFGTYQLNERHQIPEVYNFKETLNFAIIFSNTQHSGGGCL